MAGCLYRLVCATVPTPLDASTGTARTYSHCQAATVSVLLNPLCGPFFCEHHAPAAAMAWQQSSHTAKRLLGFDMRPSSWSHHHHRTSGLPDAATLPGPGDPPSNGCTLCTVCNWRSSLVDASAPKSAILLWLGQAWHCEQWWSQVLQGQRAPGAAGSHELAQRPERGHRRRLPHRLPALALRVRDPAHARVLRQDARHARQDHLFTGEGALRHLAA
mmetsp:Transcript_5759/g.14302  ORF Transcript_5759/g.14302 Transcript_5759/m.14302 type:complete len:217 (+) Transcript_5759:1077-1727(+)